MAIIFAPETAHGRELWKWDHYEDEVNPNSREGHPERGMRKREWQEFPKVLYKGGRTDAGPIGILETITVKSQLEQDNQVSRGFCLTQEDALKSGLAQTRATAAAAAELNYDVRRRSDKAQREANAIIEASEGHIGEIPAPKKRPGRPRKLKPETVS